MVKLTPLVPEDQVPTRLPPFAERLSDMLGVPSLVADTSIAVAPLLTPGMLEDMLHDSADLGDADGTHTSVEASQPPAKASTSGYVILRTPDNNRGAKQYESFLKVISSAYSGVQLAEGVAAKLAVNLVQHEAHSDSMDVVAFEFAEEVDYWAFASEVKRSIRLLTHQRSESHTHPVYSGRCTYLPASATNTKSSVFGRTKEVKTHRWLVLGESVVVYDREIGGKVVTQVDLNTVVAMTLSVDLYPPAEVLVSTWVNADNRDFGAMEKAFTTFEAGPPSAALSPALFLSLTSGSSISRSNSNVSGSGKEEAKRGPLVRRSVYRRSVGAITVFALADADLKDVLERVSLEGLGSPKGESSTPPPKPRRQTMSLMSTPPPAPPNAYSKAKGGQGPVLELQMRDREISGLMLAKYKVPMSDFVALAGVPERPESQEVISQEPQHEVVGNADKPSGGFLNLIRRPNTKDDKSHVNLLPNGKPAPDFQQYADPVPSTVPTSSSITTTINTSINTSMIAFDAPRLYRVPLQGEGTRKALRLVIKGASSLPSSTSRGLAPTVYATVYLVDAAGEKASANLIEARTEALQSFDPQWHKEVMLDTQQGGDMPEVTAVMVLLRDHAKGFRKHHHIGRVNIPISCFLENTAADFVLPLEPSYRMEDDLDERCVLGEVSFTTEMVEVDEDDESTEGYRPKSSIITQSKERHSVMDRLGHDRDSALRDHQTAAVRISIHRATAARTWWPLRLLSSNTFFSPHPKGDEHSVLNTHQAMNIDASGPRGENMGYLWCGYHCLVVELAPAAAGVLCNAEETVDGAMFVEWDNVFDCVDVSASACLLTLKLHPCTSTPAQMARQDYTYSEALVSLLIGPCPALDLCSVIKQRKRFLSAREKMVEFVSMTAGLVPHSSGETSPTLGMGLMRRGSLEDELSPRRRKTAYSHLQALLQDIIPTARSIATTLERIIKHSELMLGKYLNIPRSMALSPRGVLTPQLCAHIDAYTCTQEKSEDEAGPQSPLTVDEEGNPTAPASLEAIHDLVCTIARAKVYYAHLRHLGGLVELFEREAGLNSFGLPVYDTAAVHALVHRDCEDSHLFTPLRNDGSVGVIAARFEVFLETAILRVRDYLIFSGANWEDQATWSIDYSGKLVRAKKSLPGAAGVGKDEAIALSGRDCLQVLIASYSQTVRNYLKPFVSSQEAFVALSGQDMKNTVLRMLIDNNQRLDDAVQLAVGSAVDLQLTPSLTLVQDISTLLEWYRIALVHDTRVWMVKTMQQFQRDCINTHGFPWDVEHMQSEVVSMLPETLRFQLNMFLTICVQDVGVGEVDDKKGFFKRRELPSYDEAVAEWVDFQGSGETQPAPRYSFSLSHKQLLILRVNEKVLHALGECLVLLLVEYTRALQTRHWDQPDPKTGQFVGNLDFLCAVANDSARVVTNHLAEILDSVQVAPALKAANRKRVLAAVVPPAELAMRQIVRIVFHDVQHTLLDLESLWHDQHNKVAASMIAVVKQHIGSLRAVLHPELLGRVFGICAQTVCLRWMLFLKCRQTAFSKGEMVRFERDVKETLRCFDELDAQLGEGDVPLPAESDVQANTGVLLTLLRGDDDISSQGRVRGRCVARLSLRCLKMVCDLLTLDYESAAFHGLVTDVIARYWRFPSNTTGKHAHKNVAIAFINDCVSCIRPDTGEDFCSFAQVLLEGQPELKEKPTPVTSEDIVLRLFAKLDSPEMLNVNNLSAKVAPTKRRPSNVSAEEESKKSFMAMLSPTGAMKHFREKAADLAVKGGPGIVLSAVKQRQNEETAVGILRAIGLEVGKQSSHDDTSASVRMSRQRGGSEGRSDALYDMGSSEVLSNRLQTRLFDDSDHEDGGAGGANSDFTRSLTLAPAALTAPPETAISPAVIVEVDCVSVRALHSASFLGGPNPYIYFSVPPSANPQAKKAKTDEADVPEEKIWRQKTAVKWDVTEGVWEGQLRLQTDISQ
ncbi:hypothetical protein B484DRAFT_448094, partial [Ochromonadaceae sp. CCMP2298]